MPELPEVQVVINYLNENVLNKRITKVDIFLDKLLKNIDAKKFKSKVVNHSFKNIIRRAKFLIFVLDNDAVVLSHLRMEGKYNFDDDNSKSKHDHIIYYFENGQCLKYNDSRQFGTIHYFDNIESMEQSKEIKKLGIDPFDEQKFNYENVSKLMKKSNKKIKTFLLDQTKICGIGNIYANEICFACKIDPSSTTSKLSKKVIMDIIKYTKSILADSIKHNGTTIHTFSFNKWEVGSFQEKLLVHNAKVCKVCNSKITFEKINGRGTYVCKKCQKLIK